MSTSEYKRKQRLKTLALVFFILGIVVLFFSVLLTLGFAGTFPVMLEALYDSLVVLNRNLGSLPEFDSRVYWYVSRASGITAYVILWITVCYGLIITNKTIKNTRRLPSVYETHKILALSSFFFGLLHGLILLGDEYIQFGPAEIFIPLKSAYRPLWVSMGIVGFYLMFLLIASYYMRSFIGFRKWRIFHYTTFLGWALLTVHAFRSGTDSSTWAMRIIYSLSVLSVVTLATIRITTVIQKGLRKKRLAQNRDRHKRNFPRSG